MNYSSAIYLQNREMRNSCGECYIIINTDNILYSKRKMFLYYLYLTVYRNFSTILLAKIIKMEGEAECELTDFNDLKIYEARIYTECLSINIGRSPLVCKV